jgi:hypothetical protein
MKRNLFKEVSKICCPTRRDSLRLTPAFHQNNTNLDVNRIRRFKKENIGKYTKKKSAAFCSCSQSTSVNSNRCFL